MRRIASLALLWPYLRAHAGRVALAGAALVVAASLVLGIGQGIRHLIDRGFSTSNALELDRAALLMFAIVAALALATGARYYLVSWLGERIAADIRRDAYDRLLTLSPAYFEVARAGDILSRLTADIALLQSLIGSAISMGIRNTLMIAGSFGMLVATSPKLALIVAGVLPIVVAPLILFGRREKKLSRATQDRVADLGHQVEETIAGIRTVQAFTQERTAHASFQTAAEASVDTALRRIRVRAGLILAVILLGFGAVTFALWVGGHDVVAGRMTGGELSAFVLYAILLATSAAALRDRKSVV